MKMIRPFSPSLLNQPSRMPSEIHQSKDSMACIGTRFISRPCSAYVQVILCGLERLGLAFVPGLKSRLPQSANDASSRFVSSMYVFILAFPFTFTDQWILYWEVIPRKEEEEENLVGRVRKHRMIGRP
jgi:hypothetical protein